MKDSKNSKKNFGDVKLNDPIYRLLVYNSYINPFDIGYDTITKFYFQKGYVEKIQTFTDFGEALYITIRTFNNISRQFGEQEYLYNHGFSFKAFKDDSIARTLFHDLDNTICYFTDIEDCKKEIKHINYENRKSLHKYLERTNDFVRVQSVKEDLKIITNTYKTYNLLNYNNRIP